jgi:hypothetical protein
MLYVDAGSHHGHDLNHWLAAERQLTATSTAR